MKSYERKCTRCRKIKHISDFDSHGIHGRIRSMCRKCTEYNSDYYHKNSKGNLKTQCEIVMEKLNDQGFRFTRRTAPSIDRYGMTKDQLIKLNIANAKAIQAYPAMAKVCERVWK